MNHIHVCHPVSCERGNLGVLSRWGNYSAVGISRYGPIATIKAIWNVLVFRLLPDGLYHWFWIK